MDPEAGALRRAQQAMDRIYEQAVKLPEAKHDDESWQPTGAAGPSKAASEWAETLARLDLITDRIDKTTHLGR